MVAGALITGDVEPDTGAQHSVVGASARAVPRLPARAAGAAAAAKLNIANIVVGVVRRRILDLEFTSPSVRSGALLSITHYTADRSLLATSYLFKNVGINGRGYSTLIIR